MPPIRTTRSYSRTQDKELPPLRGMYISVSRVKPYVGNKWNCQIDLVEDCIDLCAGDPVRVSSIDVSPLKIVIDNVLEVDTRVTEEDGDDENGEGWCLV